MVEDKQSGDRIDDKGRDAQPQVADRFESEVQGAAEEHTQRAKDYVQARRDGMRDKHTGEILGAQPTFFDSLETSGKGPVAPAERLLQEVPDGATDQPVGAGKADVPSTKGHLARDTDGRVTEVVYPDGKKAAVKYGDDGKPSEITARLGNRLVKDDHGTWSLYDAGGELQGKRVKLDIKVSYDGDITVLDRDEQASKTLHPNGSLHRQYQNRSEITTDINDRPIEIRQPNGDSTRVEYDAAGSPTRVTDQDGSSWAKDGGKWTRHDRDGKQIDSLDGTIKVSVDGDIDRESADHKRFWRTSPDGSGIETTDEGVQLSRDAEGRITEIVRPNGKREMMGYNPKGELGELKTELGNSWQKNRDGTWSKFDPQGEPIKELQHQKLDIKIRPDGEIYFGKVDGTGYVVTKPDGSEHTVYADRSEVTRNNKEQPIEIRYPNGTTNRIEYDKDGPSRITDQNGNTWVKAADAWTHRDRDGKRIDSLDGKVDVTRDGDIIGIGKDGQPHWRQNRNGSRIEPTGN